MTIKNVVLSDADLMGSQTVTTDTGKGRNCQKAASGVAEWATHSLNIADGCPHDCIYCFAKAMAIRFSRTTPANWKNAAIRPEALAKRYSKKAGRIMMPTSHDITPNNLDAFLTVLMKVLAVGNEVLLVSKPHLPCVKFICEKTAVYRDQILFRFTIGSVDDWVLKAWEPGAPSFKERLASLAWAFQEGFKTSVSCEPMLDLRIDRVINRCRHYVTDSIWLGRVNRLRQTLAINLPGNSAAKVMGDVLLAEQTDDYLRELYRRYQNDPLIKFKDSIKKVAGLERPTVKGLDV